MIRPTGSRSTQSACCCHRHVLGLVFSSHVMPTIRSFRASARHSTRSSRAHSERIPTRFPKVPPVSTTSTSATDRSLRASTSGSSPISARYGWSRRRCSAAGWSPAHRDVQQTEPVAPTRLEQKSAQHVEDRVRRPSDEDEIAVACERNHPCAASEQVVFEVGVRLRQLDVGQRAELASPRDVPAKWTNDVAVHHRISCA